MRKGVCEGLEKKVCACLLKKKRASKWVIYSKGEVEAQRVFNFDFVHQLSVNSCKLFSLQLLNKNMHQG